MIADGQAALHTALAPARPIRARLVWTVSVFGLLAVATCVLAPLVGSTPISLRRALDTSLPFDTNVDAQILFIARLPRVLAGALVGAALASAGVVFQALLRNPLATPFTLGVSAGASLGAMLVLILGGTLAVGPWSPVPLASLAGATIAAAIVYALANGPRRVMSTTVLLLAGVTLNAFFSALILFVQYLADFAQVYRATRWLMGDLDVGGFGPILGALPLLVVASAIFARLPSALNLMGVDPDSASARGVDVVATQRWAFVSGSMATSAAVALAGPIGFVGIVVPHLVRLLVGADHRIVLPASALFGATFLVACDLVARTLLAPVEIPVGVVTAIIGGPFFLWLLVRRLIALLAVAAMAAMACAGGAPPQPAKAQRIVSLVPAVTEMLFAIGAGAQVVGVSNYDHFPPEVEVLPKVGALIDPDTERILSLRPNLVVVYGSQTDPEASFKRAGIQTFSYRHEASASAILATFDTITALGAATGHEAQAREVVTRMTNALAAIRTRVEGRDRPRTLLVIGREPGTLQGIYAAGGIGFLHEMLDVAGGENVFDDVQRESVQPSTETLLRRAPDALLELSAKNAASDSPDGDLAVWSKLASIPAVRNRRVHSIVGDFVVVAGPRLADGVEAMARALHPEAFK